MVSVIIPDTALTEMTVREAAATHHSQILSFIYQPRSNKELLICIDLFSSFPPDWKEESKWPFLVARQQNELWMPKTVPSVTSDPPNRGDSVCPYRAGPPTASPRRCASRSSSCTDTAGRRRSRPLWTAEKITWHDTFCFSKWNQTARLFSLLSSSGTVHAGLELRQSAQVSCWFETIRALGLSCIQLFKDLRYNRAKLRWMERKTACLKWNGLTFKYLRSLCCWQTSRSCNFHIMHFKSQTQTWSRFYFKFKSIFLEEYILKTKMNSFQGLEKLLKWNLID